MMKIANHTTTI